MPEKNETFEATIADRAMEVRIPTETQILLMGRAAKRSEGAAKAEQYKDAIYFMADALDIVDSLIVSDDDRLYLAGLMATGKLEVEEVLDLIGAAAPRTKAPTTGPATRVTRARAK